MKIKTTYNESGILIELNGNVAKCAIGCEVRYIHATKVFDRNGKSLS